MSEALPLLAIQWRGSDPSGQPGGRVDDLPGFLLESLGLGDLTEDCRVSRLTTGQPQLVSAATGRELGVGYSTSGCRGCRVSAAGIGLRVGIDVELPLDGAVTPELLGLSLTPSEKHPFAAATPQSQSLTFARLWTRKEAVLKARGVGLAMAPNLVEVGVGVVGEWSPVRLPDGTHWFVMSLPPIRGAELAVACDKMVSVLPPVQIESESGQPGEAGS